MASKVFKNAVLHWKDEHPPTIGAGLSRPRDGERTKEFTLVVRFEKTKPMRVVFRAPSAKRAVAYAKNRWPMATEVEVLK